MALQSAAMGSGDPITNIDPQGRGSWDIDDDVLRLRRWATEYAHRLPDPRVPISLGSAPTCDVQLHDEEGLLSREHAMMLPESTGWEILDRDSRNGLKVDGVATARSSVRAGAKIQLGGLVLVAESLKSIGLRSLVGRLVGWAPARQGAVDEALQSLRDCAVQRAPMFLLGDGDLVPVAARLQRRTLGPSAPFLNYEGGDIATAMRDAMRGTLCVSIDHQSTASAIALAYQAAPLATRPRLVLCASDEKHTSTVSRTLGRLAVIEVPAIDARRDEISRLVHEVGDDIMREMEVPATGFTMHDLERLQSMKFGGMSELEESIRRVIAMRTWGVTAGAKKLGIKHSSLSQWARSKNRKLSS